MEHRTAEGAGNDDGITRLDRRDGFGNDGGSGVCARRERGDDADRPGNLDHLASIVTVNDADRFFRADALPKKSGGKFVLDALMVWDAKTGFLVGELPETGGVAESGIRHGRAYAVNLLLRSARPELLGLPGAFSCAAGFLNGKQVGIHDEFLLPEGHFAANFERIDNSHDDGIHGRVFGDGGLARAGTGSGRHQVAHTGIQGIVATKGLPVARRLIGLAQDEQLAAGQFSSLWLRR